MQVVAPQLSCNSASAGGVQDLSMGQCRGMAQVRQLQQQEHTKCFLRAICQVLIPLSPLTHSHQASVTALNRAVCHPHFLTNTQTYLVTSFLKQIPFTSGKSLSLHSLAKPFQFHLNVFEFAYLKQSELWSWSLSQIFNLYFIIKWCNTSSLEVSFYLCNHWVFFML